MNRANFFKSMLGVLLLRKPPEPEIDYYVGEIRGGQIWKQDDFPYFSVMLVPGITTDPCGDFGPSYWIMIPDPRRSEGSMAIGWDNRTLWTTRELEAFLARPVPFSCKGDCSKLILDHWYDAMCQEPLTT